MLQIQEKTVVCQTHKALLYLLVRYGNGALPLPLLRTLAVQMRLYPNGQAVNRAVRELREAGVLDRQTWVDNNSDLILVHGAGPLWGGDFLARFVEQEAQGEFPHKNEIAVVIHPRLPVQYPGLPQLPHGLVDLPATMGKRKSPPKWRRRRPWARKSNFPALNHERR